MGFQAVQECPGQSGCVFVGGTVREDEVTPFAFGIFFVVSRGVLKDQVFDRLFGEEQVGFVDDDLAGLVSVVERVPFSGIIADQHGIGFGGFAIFRDRFDGNFCAHDLRKTNVFESDLNFSIGTFTERICVDRVEEMGKVLPVRTQDEADAYAFGKLLDLFYNHIVIPRVHVPVGG